MAEIFIESTGFFKNEKPLIKKVEASTNKFMLLKEKNDKDTKTVHRKREIIYSYDKGLIFTIYQVLMELYKKKM